MNDISQWQKEIKDSLTAFQQEAQQKKIRGDSAWTANIKHRLGELGESKGFKICAAGFPDWFEREWLYDLVWYIENKNGLMVAIPLVMESEWDLKLPGVKFDFEKLMVANAQLRLMICQSKDAKQAELVSYFKKAITAYTLGRPEDTFLIAILSNESEEFAFYEFTRSNLID